MKKFLLSLSVIFSFGLYAVFISSNRADVVTPGNVISGGKQPDASGVQVPVPSPTPTPVSQGMGQYINGSYLGNVTDAYYGNIQVRVIIQNGRLADVIFLQYPNDHVTSIRISNESMPQLKSEAIQAQSSQVDVVSGATQTSEAFIISLASALLKAK